MTEQDEAIFAAHIRGALTEISAGDGSYQGVCRTEVSMMRAAWLGLQQDRAKLHRLQGCEFCKILRGETQTILVQEWNDAVAILPINPVAKGHMLILPRVHVEDFTDSPQITAAVFKRASELAYARGGGLDMNLITSKGPAATQTVYHFHVHLVPRMKNDGLALPWSR